MSDLVTAARLLLPRGSDGAVPADTWQELLAAAPAVTGAVPTPVSAPEVRGREPAPSGTGVLPLLAHAAEREVVLARLRRRPPAGYTRTRVLRTRPAVMGTGPLGSARSRLAGGAAVLLAAGPPTASVLDEVVAAAGMNAHQDIRPGSGGVLLVSGRRAGRPVLLRVGPATVVTQAAVEGLRALAGSRLVPDLLADGWAADLRWTLEGRLPGRRPGRLHDRTVREAVAFAAAMPTGVGSPVTSAVGVLGTALPALASELTQVAGWAADRASALPTVAVHGDFWPGNLLASRGRLTGVVDWDAFRPAGVAGIDVLHLLATQERRRLGQELGPQVLQSPWSQARFTSVAAAYWASVGADPDPGELEALGALWWLDQVAGTLARLPAKARDARWVDLNVTGVLRGTRWSGCV